MKQRSIFDEADRLARLAELGDQLLKLDNAIDWRVFRPTLKRVSEGEAKGVGGRPPFDRLMLFKILILQQLYNVSDAQAEYQINDRISFQRFLGLTVSDKVPDEKTIWAFREKLVRSGAASALFERFSMMLKERGLITHTGSIVDAAFVDAPRRRGTREQNRTVKEGGMPDGWDDNPNVRRQKDMDAKWAKKNNETHFGYKDHIKADAESKLIVSYSVTAASVHDSQPAPGLLNADEDKVFFADSAYEGVAVPEGVEAAVCEKGHRGHPLTEGQKERNKLKSRTRCRVEHVFGHMVKSMGGRGIRCVGQRRAEFVIGLKNLAYNMSRYEFLTRLKPATG